MGSDCISSSSLLIFLLCGNMDFVYMTFDTDVLPFLDVLLLSF